MACNTHLILAMLLISSFVVAPAMAGRGTGELVYHVHQKTVEENMHIQLVGPRKLLQNTYAYRRKACDPSVQYC